MAIEVLSAGEATAALAKLPTIFKDKKLPDGISWQPRRIEARQFQNVNFRTIRITGSVFRSARFSGCDFSRCRFEGTYWSDLTFEDCTFDGMEFGSKIENYVEKTTFAHCTFREVRIAVTRFYACTFESSSFADSNMERVRFEKASLKNVVITGRYSGMVFVNCDMQKLDLSLARLNDFAIVKPKSVDVRFPSNVIDTSLLVAVMDDARGTLSPADFEKFKRIAEGGSTSPMNVSLDPQLFAGLTSAGRDRIVELLTSRAITRGELESLQ